MLIACSGGITRRQRLLLGLFAGIPFREQVRQHGSIGAISQRHREATECELIPCGDTCGFGREYSHSPSVAPEITGPR